MLRNFRIFNNLNNLHFTSIGGAGSFNSNLELIPHGRLRLIENFFYGRAWDGGYSARVRIWS
jgi:hypothetical protein